MAHRVGETLPLQLHPKLYYGMGTVTCAPLHLSPKGRVRAQEETETAMATTQPLKARAETALWPLGAKRTNSSFSGHHQTASSVERQAGDVTLEKSLPLLVARQSVLTVFSLWQLVFWVDPVPIINSSRKQW